MSRFAIWSIVFAKIFFILGITEAAADAADFFEKYVVEVRTRKDVTSKSSSKLSPALLATKDAKGILEGADLNGSPIISVTEGNLARLKSSHAVEGFSPNLPKNWRPVKRLKLSYRSGKKPTDADLRRMKLTLIEDYKKGAFLIVKPESGPIDAKLITSLEESPNTIHYVTSLFQVKAIRPIVKASVSKNKKENKKPKKPPTNDPRWKALWGMRNIRSPRAWKAVKQSPIIVAVIDTGVDYKHEDLKGNMWKDANGKHGYNYVDNNSDPMDKDGHGTHCAGTIGAVGNNRIGVVGVNWGVKIMVLRWLDEHGAGEVTDAIKCIDYAIEHNAKVLSNSWYWIDDDPDLESAIERAKDRKALFVVAASNWAEKKNNNNGNNDKESTYGRYPSSYSVSSIVAVGAIDAQGAKAPFSNFGKKTVDLFAPGVSIMSTVPNNKYSDDYSGTSMATPHVAGAAALILGHPQYKNASFAKVKDLLIEHVRKSATLKNLCKSGGTLDISFLEPKKKKPETKKKRRNSSGSRPQ